VWEDVRRVAATMTEAGARLRTSISATQALASPGRQMSNDPGMFENPFRDGGDLSKDADVIIDALKTGKLSVISNVSNGTPDLVLEERDVMDNSDHVEKNGGGMLVEPRERKNGQNGEVDVQRGLVVNTKQAAVERVVIDEKKQKCKCCVLQ